MFKIFLKKIGFSRVVVGTVKEAIAALEAVGNELRAAEVLAEARRIAATEELRERAWS